MSELNVERYEIRNGKWGAYFYDTLTHTALTLKDVIELLNELNLRKLEDLGETLGGPQR